MTPRQLLRKFARQEFNRLNAAIKEQRRAEASLRGFRRCYYNSIIQQFEQISPLWKILQRPRPPLD